MDVNKNNNIPSTWQEDLELFRRVMRVMNILQNRELNTPNHPISSSPTRHLQTTLYSDLWSGRPDMDEDESTDDDDEEDNEDNDDEDDEDFGEDEDMEDDDGSESDNVFSCHEELQPPQNPQDVLSRQQQNPSPTTRLPGPAISDAEAMEQDDQDVDGNDLRCWDHGCNGRKFTTRSNLRRHLREKSRAPPSCRCLQCGAVFSRTTARNTHIARKSCNRIRRYSNGRIRPNLIRIKDKDRS